MYHLDAESLDGRPELRLRADAAIHPDGSGSPSDQMPVQRVPRTGGAPVVDAVVGTESAWSGFGVARGQRPPMPRRAGRTVGAVLVFEDVTETMRMRHELVRSEEQLSQARRAGRVGLWEWNTDEQRGVARRELRADRRPAVPRFDLGLDRTWSISGT